MKDKKKVKAIAKERIDVLFKEASKSRDEKLQNRYVNLARKIAMKAKVRIPRKYKRKFCKHCYSYLTSKNSRTRIKDKKVIISCFNCKKFIRIPLR